MGAKSKLHPLDEIAELISHCENCRLYQGRNRTVPGEGSPTAKIMFIAEAPGETEDAAGRPLIGISGQEWRSQLKEAFGDVTINELGCLPADWFYVTNINKCRPPGNRIPLSDEVTACLPFLEQQVDHIQPLVIVALGATSAKALLGIDDLQWKITQHHGEYGYYRGRLTVIAFHPRYCLQNGMARLKNIALFKEVIRKCCGQTKPQMVTSSADAARRRSKKATCSDCRSPVTA